MDWAARFVLTCRPQAERVRGMDKELLEALARRAGLAKALAEFPDDVAAAAEQAASVMVKIKAPEDPRAEPWPAMKPGDGL
jgi:chorismate mutase